MIKKSILEVLQDIVELTGKKKIQVFYHKYRSLTTRFFRNFIHQNTFENNNIVTLKSSEGHYFSFNFRNYRELLKNIKRYIKQEITDGVPYRLPYRQIREEEFMRRQYFLDRKNIQYKNIPLNSLLHEKEILYRAHSGAIKDITDVLLKKNLESFGVISTGFTEMAVANTKGLLDYQYVGDITSNITIMDSKGMSSYLHFSIPLIPEKITFFPFGTEQFTTVFNNVLDSFKFYLNKPVNVFPGKYTVFLEPMAVADLIMYFTYLGFSGKRYEEGMSFLKNKMGKRTFSKNLNLIDDPESKYNYNYLFDMDGVRKKSIYLIKEGIPLNVLYDLETAYKYGKKSTGHGMWGRGPVPMSLHVVPAKNYGKDREKMIKSIKKGLLINRFHYINVAEPSKCVLTGMTRNGIFLIEDGEIVAPVKNMRFTMSMLDAFANIVAISKNGKLISAGNFYGPRYPAGTYTSAMVIRDFNFSSGTKF